MAIGSGGNYALAAARALYNTKLDAEKIAIQSLEIAAELCIYTNDNITFEKIKMTSFTPRGCIRIRQVYCWSKKRKKAVAIALRNRWRRQQIERLFKR